MSDSAHGLDLHPTGKAWETRNPNDWTPDEPVPPKDAPASEAGRPHQRDDDVRSSYFHVRWLGEAD